MLILLIRTDKPEAEIYLYDGKKLLDKEIWQAHRQLAETLHLMIRDLLGRQSKDWSDIGGLVCYRGPGSFTGLRIGLSVANALAMSLDVPVIGSTDDNWKESGISQLLEGKDNKLAIPEYGAPVHITSPRK